MATRKYPGIARACTRLAYCCNGINCNRSEADQLKDYDAWIKTYAKKAKLTSYHLSRASRWISRLTNDELDVLVDGEDSECKALMRTAPAFLDDLLNAYFEGPC